MSKRRRNKTPRAESSGKKSRRKSNDESSGKAKRSRVPPKKDSSQTIVLTLALLVGGAILLMIASSVVNSNNATKQAEQKRVDDIKAARIAEKQKAREEAAAKKAVPKYIAPTAPGPSTTAPGPSTTAPGPSTTALGPSTTAPSTQYKPTAKATILLDTSTGSRVMVAECLQCKTRIKTAEEPCPKCNAKLTWEEKIKCPMCFKKESSDVNYCYDCKGTKKRPDYDPRARGPMGIKSDDGTCTKCGGSGKCSWCYEGILEDPEFSLSKQ